VLVVLALHGAVFYALWSARVIPPPAEAVALFVHFITPPPPKPHPVVVPPPVVPKPAKRKAPPPVEPPHRHLAAKAPVTSPLEAVEPLPPLAPAIEPAPEAEPAPAESPAPVAPPPAPAKPVDPMMLNAELALACTQRTPPSYPRMSRRLGETGKTVLRVELDETGQVGAAQVITSSGFERLDAAALAAVKTWRCRPAQRDGSAVRSVATQPFKFTLEGR
jgi:protein TonB